jgi:hypothetical protein
MGLQSVKSFEELTFSLLIDVMQSTSTEIRLKKLGPQTIKISSLNQGFCPLLTLHTGIENLIMYGIGVGFDRLDEYALGDEEQIFAALGLTVDLHDIGFKLFPIVSFFLSDLLNLISGTSLVSATRDIASFNWG